MRNHLESSVSWSVNPCSHMVQWESLFSAWLYRVKGDVFLLCVVCCSRDDRTEELDGLSGKVAGTNSLPTAKQLLRLCLWSDGGWEGKHTWKPGLMFFSLKRCQLLKVLPASRTASAAFLSEGYWLCYRRVNKKGLLGLFMALCLISCNLCREYCVWFLRLVYDGRSWNGSELKLCCPSPAPWRCTKAAAFVLLRAKIACSFMLSCKMCVL